MTHKPCGKDLKGSELEIERLRRRRVIEILVGRGVPRTLAEICADQMIRRWRTKDEMERRMLFV